MSYIRYSILVSPTEGPNPVKEQCYLISEMQWLLNLILSGTGWELKKKKKIGCAGSSSLCTGLFAAASRLSPVAVVILQYLSFPTRDQTHVPCIGRRILNHWTTMEVPSWGFSSAKNTGSSLIFVQTGRMDFGHDSHNFWGVGWRLSRELKFNRSIYRRKSDKDLQIATESTNWAIEFWAQGCTLLTEQKVHPELWGSRGLTAISNGMSIVAVWEFQYKGSDYQLSKGRALFSFQSSKRMVLKSFPRSIILSKYKEKTPPPVCLLNFQHSILMTPDVWFSIYHAILGHQVDVLQLYSGPKLPMVFFVLDFFFLLATLYSMLDHSSLITDWICTLCRGSTDSSPLDSQGSPELAMLTPFFTQAPHHFSAVMMFQLNNTDKIWQFLTSFITNLSFSVIFITLIFHFSPIWSQLPLVSLQVTLNMAYFCFKALVLVPLAWNVLPLDIPIACYFTSLKYLLRCLFCSEACSNPLKFHPLVFSIFLTLI